MWPRCDRRSRPRRIEPWERPCDRYDYVAVGVHHHCALTPARDVTPDLAVASPVGQLACDGHDAHGQTSLWDKSQLRSWHLQSIDAAADANASARPAAGDEAARSHVAAGVATRRCQ